MRTNELSFCVILTILLYISSAKIDPVLALVPAPQPWFFIKAHYMIFGAALSAALVGIFAINCLSFLAVDGLLLFTLISYLVTKSFFIMRDTSRVATEHHIPGLAIGGSLVFCFGLTLITSRLILRRPDFHKALNVCVLSAATLFLIASIHTGIVAPLYAFDSNGRFVGIGEHPVDTAYVFFFGMLYSYEALATTSSNVKRFIFAGLAICFLICLGATGTRTGLLCSVLVAFPYIYYSNRRHFAVITLCCVIASVAVGILWLDRIREMRIFSTDDTRSGALGSIYKEILANPLLGSNTQDIKTENSYLLLMARTGLFGLAFLVPFFSGAIYLFLKCLRTLKKVADPNVKRPIRLAIFNILALFVLSNFSWYLWSEFSFCLILLWVYLGQIHAYGKR